MSVSALLSAALGLLAGFIIVGAWGHHMGFTAGRNQQIALYAPLLAAANAAKDQANARTAAKEREATRINEQSERDHDAFNQELDARSAAADARIADVLRQRAASQSAARRCQLPGVSDPPTVAFRTAASDEGDERLAERVSAVGRQCEHDAAQVAGLQRWHAQQAAIRAEAVR